MHMSGCPPHVSPSEALAVCPTPPQRSRAALGPWHACVSECGSAGVWPYVLSVPEWGFTPVCLHLSICVCALRLYPWQLVILA